MIWLAMSYQFTPNTTASMVVLRKNWKWLILCHDSEGVYYCFRAWFIIFIFLYNQLRRRFSMALAYVWDYDIDETQFRALLDGKQSQGRLDSDWAAIRLLDYASYPDIIRLLGFKRLVEGWPRWREHIRSNSRRRSFDFLSTWLPNRYPELIYSNNKFLS